MAPLDKAGSTAASSRAPHRSATVSMSSRAYMSLGFHKLAGAWLDYKLVNVRRLGGTGYLPRLFCIPASGSALVRYCKTPSDISCTASPHQQQALAKVKLINILCDICLHTANLLAHARRDLTSTPAYSVMRREAGGRGRVYIQVYTCIHCTLYDVHLTLT